MTLENVSNFCNVRANSVLQDIPFAILVIQSGWILGDRRPCPLQVEQIVEIFIPQVQTQVVYKDAYFSHIFFYKYAYFSCIFIRYAYFSRRGMRHGASEVHRGGARAPLGPAPSGLQSPAGTRRWKKITRTSLRSVISSR